MTLATFLDAAYAIQVREATRLGIPLLDTLRKMQNQARRTTASTEKPGQASERAIAQQNERGLQQIQRALAGATRRA